MQKRYRSLRLLVAFLLVVGHAGLAQALTVTLSFTTPAPNESIGAGSTVTYLGAANYDVAPPGDNPQSVKAEWIWSSNGVNNGTSLDSEWANLTINGTQGVWKSAGTLTATKYYVQGSYYVRATPYSGAQPFLLNGNVYNISVVVSLN